MKKLSAVTLPFFTYLSLSLPAFAQSIDPCPKDQPGSTNFNPLCGIGADNLGAIIQGIITMMFIVATLLALGFLIFGCIKWITSGGDKAGVETARNIIVAALVGLVVVFLSYFVLTFVLKFFNVDISTFQFTIPEIGA